MTLIPKLSPRPPSRYVQHLLEGIPFPCVGRPRILASLDASTQLSLSLPEDSPMGVSGARFRDLLAILRPHGCVQVTTSTN